MSEIANKKWYVVRAAGGKEKKAKKTVNAAETGRDILEAGRKAVAVGEKAVRLGESVSRIVKMLK